MKVAALQMAPGQDRQRNLANAISMIQSAAAEGAELVVLPELCTSPYMLDQEDLSQWAESIPTGSAVQSWLLASRELEITIVAGVLEVDEGKFYNTAVCLSRGKLVGRYRKVHLFGWERGRLSAGGSLRSFDEVAGLKLGMLICYDLRFGEAVRALALSGIQLLAVPTTWTDIGKAQPFDAYGLPGAAHLALGHAYANGIYVLCAGRVGEEQGVRYLGNSLIGGPNGQAVAGPASPDLEQVIVADIEPALADRKQIGAANHLFDDRRTDVY